MSPIHGYTSSILVAIIQCSRYLAEPQNHVAFPLPRMRGSTTREGLDRCLGQPYSELSFEQRCGWLLTAYIQVFVLSGILIRNQGSPTSLSIQKPRTPTANTSLAHPSTDALICADNCVKVQNPWQGPLGSPAQANLCRDML